MWFLLVACSASTPTPVQVPPDAPVSTAPAPASPASPSTPGDGATVQTMLGEAAGIHFLGDWTSPACGGRGYARNLTFFEDGQYAAVDLVSPCPEGTACVWSGLVGYAGMWRQQGPKLELREIGGGAAQGAPHPTEFTSDTAGNFGENGCLYTQGLTIPPGYTEDRVRPKEPAK